MGVKTMEYNGGIITTDFNSGPGAAPWKRYVLWSLVLQVVPCWVTLTHGFNLDVISPTVFSGPANSYFGYSVALHSNVNGKWLLAGAPHASSSFQAGLEEPGALYKCPLPKGECTQVKVDDQGNVNTLSNRTGLRYREIKDHMWLGVSTSSHQRGAGAVVVCGHLWTDTRYRRHHMSNGVCYEIGGALDFRSVKKLLPLTKTGFQIERSGGKYLYALGLAGMATHYTQDGTKLLLGAPGITDWRGGIVHYDHPLNRTDDYVVPASSSDFPEEDSYLGYSVASGRFYSDDSTYYVAGAPRTSANGRVYIYSGVFEVRVEKSGSQMGAYFGASVCAVDINRDGLDDLLVGAPLYKSNVYEEGRVYVYMNKDLGILVDTQNPLVGLDKPGARFGSAIAAAGDLNYDGFHDVVVGAPYEDDGHGAVYVYTGEVHGLRTTYSQRLDPSSLGSGLEAMRGFGQSLSTGVDVDNNLYEDVGVGAYKSGHAVVLRARPVIHMQVTMDFKGAPINLRWKRCYDNNQELRTCVAVGFAFKYDRTPSVPETMDVRVTLQLDTLKTGRPRAFFADPYGNTTWVGSLHLYAGRKQETNLRVLFHKRINDILTPVQFRLTYELQFPTSNSVTPILDQIVPKEIYNQVSFSKDCGSDEVCHTDLMVSASPVIPQNRPYLILGDKTHFSLKVDVLNSGEAAYLAYVIIRHPDEVQYVNVKTGDAGDRVVCDPNTDTVNLTRSVVCEVGNPIVSNGSRTFQLTFDPRHALEIRDVMHMDVIVDSGSTEINGTEDDNFAELSIPLEIDTTMEITGTSVPEIVFFETEIQQPPAGHEEHGGEMSNEIPMNDSASDVQVSYPLVRHVFDVKNRGPGLVPVTKVRLDVPTLTDGNQPILHDMRVELASDGQIMTAAGGCQSSEPVRHPKVGQSTLLDHVTSTFSLKRGFNPILLDCVNAQCVSHWCSIGQMSALDNVVITLAFHLNMTALRGLESEAIYLQTSAILGEEETGLWEKQVVSPVFARKPKAGHLAVPWWVLAISAGGGLIMLIAVIIILKKCGFFRRPHYEDLQRLVAESKDNEENEYVFDEDDDNAHNHITDGAYEVPATYDSDGYLEASKLNGYAAGAVGGFPYISTNGYAGKSYPSPKMSPKVDGNPRRKLNDYGVGKGKGKGKGAKVFAGTSPPKGYDVVRGHAGQRLGEPSSYLCGDSEDEGPDYSEIEDEGLGYAGVGGYPINNNNIIYGIGTGIPVSEASYPAPNGYPGSRPKGYPNAYGYPGSRANGYPAKETNGYPGWQSFPLAETNAYPRHSSGEDGYLEPCQLHGRDEEYSPEPRKKYSTSSQAPLVSNRY